MAQTMAAKSMASRSPNNVAVASRMERSLVDRLISWTGVVVAVALLGLRDCDLRWIVRPQQRQGPSRPREDQLPACVSDDTARQGRGP